MTDQELRNMLLTIDRISDHAAYTVRAVTLAGTYEGDLTPHNYRNPEKPLVVEVRDSRTEDARSVMLAASSIVALIPDFI